MPGKPAARLGDTAMDCADPVDTPTGTVVAAGTVFINKMPAAKQGDQIVGTDIHIIMIPTPGGPVPTPLPHPFTGIIDGGTVPTVKILGMPAAVVGSTATNTPPHIPQGGAFQKPPLNKSRIIMGSPNVFIDSGGGGGGGGGSGSVSGATDGIFNVSMEPSSAESEASEGHYIDVTPVDGAGNPVLGAGYGLTDSVAEEDKGLVSGAIRRYGIPEGDGKLALNALLKAAWSVSTPLEPGATVGLILETVGAADGTPVVFKIWERDTNRPDRLVARIDDKQISGDKAEASWIYELSEQVGDIVPGDAYSRPDYYFTVMVGDTELRSPILACRAALDIQFIDDQNDPIADEPYRLFVTTGLVEEGATDGDGRIFIENLPPRKVKVVFPESPGTLKASLEFAPDPNTGDWIKAKPEPMIADLKWAKERAIPGEEVTLTARIANFSNPDLVFESEEKFEMTVFEYAEDGAHKKKNVIEDVIIGETLSAVFKYPEDVDENDGNDPQFFFTVKIRDTEVGAEQESGLLTRLLGMYVVKQNEDLASILFRLRGLTDTAPVQNHSKNKKLFDTRTEHLLYPGDALCIPDYDGTPINATDDQDFLTDSSKGRPLRLRIETRTKGILSNAPYKLYVAEQILEGVTDGAGILNEKVPLSALKARLEIGGQIIKLELAGLDPPHTVRGVQGRLANLGYYVGKIDGKLGQQSKNAIKKFQADRQLKVDGIVGPNTRAELVSIHGC